VQIGLLPQNILRKRFIIAPGVERNWWKMNDINLKARATNAGIDLGKALIEMVHLMYQNRTAMHFYSGLMYVLEPEMELRKAEFLGQMKEEVKNES
jgi:hypothetical protein